MNERGADQQRKRAKRATERDVEIPRCANRRRRNRLEKGDEKWLRWYFGEGSGCPDPFTYEFTDQQCEMIQAIQHAIQFGGDQALAASRGEGKTTLCERLLLKYVLAGTLSYPVFFAATSTLAMGSLETLKDAVAENDRLAADYPEACIPVRALENTPNRAHYQTVSGKRHDNGKPYRRHPARFLWCGHEFTLPNVPGAPCAGAMVATRGLDAAVRGLKRKGKRPDLAVIDDPDTEETARSEDQAEKLGKRIDQAIGGLGSQRRPIARVMLTTLQSRISVSYQYTDPAEKPTWKGRRFRYLVTPPERTDLWDQFQELRHKGLQGDPAPDPFGREAHKFYLSNRAEMDRGAEVANPNRFDPAELPDGSQMEASSLEHYYNEVVRIGEVAVATEYDNDPPEDAGAPIGSSLTAYRVRHQLSGYPRRIVPPECLWLTFGGDVAKHALHWVVDAWRGDATGYRLDYGVEETNTQPGTTDEAAIDMGILRALHTLRERFLSGEYEYRTSDGEVRSISLGLIDAHYRKLAVYQFVRDTGQRQFMGSMGFGLSGDHKRGAPSFTAKKRGRKLGDQWRVEPQPGGIKLVEMDSDHWKLWKEDRYLTPKDRPGTFLLFGDKPKTHFALSKHVTNEEIQEKYVKGRGMVRAFEQTGINHWKDADYMSAVAASMLGVKLLGGEVTGRVVAPAPRKRLSELRAEKRPRG